MGPPTFSQCRMLWVTNHICRGFLNHSFTFGRGRGHDAILFFGYTGAVRVTLEGKACEKIGLRLRIE